MTGEWRPFATTVATLGMVAGLALFIAGAGPAVLIICAVAMVALLAERTYRGPARELPGGDGWTATKEKFVDPETGLATRVWYHAATGERRYVAEAEPD